MHQLFVLYEDATGYALFRTSEFEEIATFLPQVQDSILDSGKFRSVVYLAAFQKFDTWQEGLENLKCISNGTLHKTLQLFLENNVPKSKKSKQSIMLGVQDPALASEISEKMGMNCSTSGAVFEIIRGIRFHFRKMVKSFNDEAMINKSKLALSHHYSRDKAHLTLNKFDSMITYGLDTIDQLKKDIGVLALRVRKLYDCHFPELYKIINDPQLYVKCVKEIKDRKNMSENIEEVLFAVLKDQDKVQDIIKSAQKSMGMEISEEDMDNICVFIDQILSLAEHKETQSEYVKTKMHLIAPSLGNLMGELAGARLISTAGSLTHLSKLPASTVQILGAKKSLFRALKSKNAPLKFSFVSKSSCIGQDGRVSKSQVSRFLANKCCLAARSDCFNVSPTGVHGSKLKQEVEERIRFLEYCARSTKGLPRKKKQRNKRRKVIKVNKNVEVNGMDVER